MKLIWPAYAVLTLLVIGVFFSCRKSFNEPEYSQPGIADSIQAVQVDTAENHPLSFAVLCLEGPNYGDSIIYPQPANPGQDYVVAPTNPASGTYMAFPKGLSIDPKTGAIDITKSQTGMRYEIGFVKTGANDTCFHPIILAGSSYMDSVYTLENNETHAFPYFNANPAVTTVCGVGSGCRFDISHKASGKGVKIDPETGVMELQGTQDIFGSHPFNGEFSDVMMDYSLNDKSNQAIQQLSVRFIYFNRRTDIPSWLLNMIKSRRGNALQNDINDTGGPLKPTMIIITRYK